MRTGAAESNASGRGRLLVLVALGGLGFALLHLFLTLFWERWFVPARLDVPWFLGSRRSLATAQVAFGAMACLLGLSLGRRAWGQRLVDGAAFAGGAVAVMSLTFAAVGAEWLLVGPVHLWPVALTAGAIALALPVLAGTLAAGLLRPPW